MNLRAQAEADTAFLLEDATTGFGVAITLTDLAGTVYQVAGQYHRIGVDIDPETGLLVPGKKSAITVRASRFAADNLPDEGWLVETTDITGAAVKGRIAFAMPDLTSGRISATLKKG